MDNKTATFLYRRDWRDDDDESDNEAEADQVMDGFFGNKQPEKKPDGKCGEPPKKAPEKKCPEPQPSCPKPEAKKKCPCKPKKKRSRSACKKPMKKARSACKKVAKKQRQPRCPGSTPRSRNPFIIFFLTMLSQQKNRRASDVAREAGKQWCGMDTCTKAKYQKLAKAERMRRQRMQKKRKC